MTFIQIPVNERMDDDDIAMQITKYFTREQILMAAAATASEIKIQTTNSDTWIGGVISEKALHVEVFTKNLLVKLPVQYR